MDQLTYQKLWKRSEFKIAAPKPTKTITVNGVTIPYFGIHKMKDCAKCKGYHLTHLPTGYLVMSHKTLQRLKTVGLICLDRYGDYLDFDFDRPAPMEFRNTWKKLLDELGRLPHGGPSGSPQPWIKDS